MAGNNKPRLLMIAPLPPPVHGSSLVSRSMTESHKLNEAFTMDLVNLSTSRKMEEVGSLSKMLMVRKTVRFIASCLRMTGLLLTHRYDLCYLAITCHGVGFLKDAPFVLLCKLFGNRVVIHQHNKGMSRDADKPLYRRLLRMVYKNAKVILLSWHLFPDIEKIVRREDVVICPNGITPEADTAPRHTPNDVPRLLFLSNLLRDKGVLTLLDALKILKDGGHAFVCDFVGSETRDMDAEMFRTEVRERGLEGIAIYHGSKYGKDKETYFKHADMFVFPSFDECLPLVILEAMEYGLPVVSTGEGGIRDEVEDGRNGFVVETQSADALADAIERLISDEPLRRSMGEEGRRMFEERFTMERFEERMCDILRSCIK